MPITVNEVLEQVNLAIDSFTTIIELANITDKQRAYFIKKYAECVDYREKLAKGNYSQEELEENYNNFLDLYAKLNSIINTCVPKNEENEVASEEEKNIQKVTRVIPKEEQSEETKASVSNSKIRARIVLIICGVAVLALIVGANIYSCSKKKAKSNDNDSDKETTIEGEPIKETVTNDIKDILDLPDVVIEEETEIISETNIEKSTINKIPSDVLENSDSLYAYASYLKETYNLSLTENQIVDAINLGNIEYLMMSPDFNSREQILESTINLGILNNTVGSDLIVYKQSNASDGDIYINSNTLKDILESQNVKSLNVNSFITEGNAAIDVYNLLEICAKHLNDENGFEYAKVFNEIVARSVHNNTITYNAPLQTAYSILGMFNANLDKLKALTAGQRLGPIYGTGGPVDETYGDICIEDLVYKFEIRNENGVYTANDNSKDFYTLYYNDLIYDVIMPLSNSKNNRY